MTQPFAQLTFTSYEPADGSLGGWRVKEILGDFPESEQTWAMKFVASVLRPVLPVARFPSAEQIDALPRRLLFTVGEDLRTVLFIHSAPAGSDGSGRQGNVFNHVLLDRGMVARLGGPTPWRPIQLWRSPGWLTPYGVEAVQEATLGDTLPTMSSRLDRANVSAFLTEKNGARLSGLGALLDAYADTLDDGPPVVVIVDDLDDGALWIAALSFLSAPQAAVQMTFSTFERASDLVTSGPRTRISVMQREDLTDTFLASEWRFVVVDPLHQTSPIDSGWATANGKTVVETDWSRLAVATCRGGPGVLADRMLAVEELSEWNPEPATACLWWSLALAVTEEPLLSDAWPIAAREVLKGAPDEDKLDPETRVRMGKLQRAAAGDTAADAWGLLEDLRDAGRIGPDRLTVLYSTYVNRVLQDHDVLLAQSRPPVLTLPAAVRDAVLSSVAQVFLDHVPLVVDPSMDDETWAALALRYMDLATRVGLAIPPGAPPPDWLGRLARLLSGELGPQVTTTAGALEPAVLRDVAAFMLAEARATGTLSRDLVHTVLHNVGGGRLWTPADLRWIVRNLGNGAAVDFAAEACRSILVTGPGKDSAELAAIFLEQVQAAETPIDAAELEVLKLATDLGLGWEKGLAALPIAVRVVNAACLLHKDGNRLDPDDWDLWAPAILTAGVRVALAPASRPAADGRPEQLADPPAVREMLDSFAPGSTRVVVDDLVTMLQVDDQLAIDLFRLGSQLNAGQAVDTILDPAFLLAPTGNAPDGGDLVTATLRAYLETPPTSQSWLQDRFASHPWDPDPVVRDRAMTWARSLQQPAIFATAPLTQGK